MARDLHRRDFLGMVGGAGTIAAIAPEALAVERPAFLRDIASAADVTVASATQIAAAIRAKKVSSLEVVEACLVRIEQVNPKLNAVVQLTADAARAEARAADAALARGQAMGPLHGVPCTIKDTIETAGVPCTGGTKGRANYLPKADDTVVARLRKAGAVVLGKTNVPELASAFESDNLVYGRTNNPYDLARSPGGSSGGEAAIIAAGGAPFGLGTDAGGSTRVPAHFCGIAGIKPNSGRSPRTGQFPFPIGMRTALSHMTVLSRHVEDLGLVLAVMQGPDAGDHTVPPMPLGKPDAVRLKGLRIAFFTDNGASKVSPETVAAVERAAKALADAGVTVEEARPPGADACYTLFHDLFRPDGGAGIRGFLKSVGTTEISPMMERSLQTLFAPAMSAPGEVLGAAARWDAFRNGMLQFAQTYDGLLSPVCPFPAPLHGTSFDEDKLPGFGYAMMHNLSGWPSTAVRAGTSPEGLPIGVQIAARPWREDVSLALAQAVEKRLAGSWKSPKPV